jgi:N-acyl-phosphatidylethanolamine-hydrolysing phospholipase D
MKRTGRWCAGLTTVLAALLCFGCGTSNPYYDAIKPHHTATGFRNNYLPQGIAGGLNFLEWQWERWRDGVPKPPANGYRFPMAQPDLPWLTTNRSQTSATWIGHASVLMQVNGVNVLTDPIFSERASPVSFAGPQRKVAPGLSLAQLPHVDVVLISHNHFDHLDRDSVVALNAQAGGPPLFLVPLGLKTWMADIGITNVRELDWWSSVAVPGLDVHFVPVQHWSARGMHDRFDSLWGGWMVRTAANAVKPFSFFFAGDTGYSRDFADIAAKFGSVDLALLPIGAYAPRWFMKSQHIDPAEAIQIHRDLRARQSIAIHWGTFELADDAIDEAPALLKREMQQAGVPTRDFSVLKHGETRRF